MYSNSAKFLLILRYGYLSKNLKYDLMKKFEERKKCAQKIGNCHIYFYKIDNHD